MPRGNDYYARVHRQRKARHPYGKCIPSCKMKHGKEWHYSAGCRCDECKAAFTQSQEQRYSKPGNFAIRQWAKTMPDLADRVRDFGAIPDDIILAYKIAFISEPKSQL